MKQCVEEQGLSMLAEDGIPRGHPWADAGTGLARGTWPAHWVSVPEARNENFVALYRLRFDSGCAETVRVFVSADERYELLLDGVSIGRGPERGDPRNWYFQAYDLCLAAGEHTLLARVWSQGVGTAPWSHLGLRHGFLLAAREATDFDRFNTGLAAWQGRPAAGFRFVRSGKELLGPARANPGWASHELVDGETFCWEAFDGAGEGWEPVTRGHRGRTLGAAGAIHTFEHMLRPGSLPSLDLGRRRPGRVVNVEVLDALDPADAFVQAFAVGDEIETLSWQTWWSEAASDLVVPPGSRRRILIDLGDYYNAYLGWRARGGRGARIGLDMGERLRRAADEAAGRGSRDEWAGGFWSSPSATWRLPGGEQVRTGRTLWWRAGRYLQILAQTAEDPLVLEALWLEETRFPLEDEIGVSASDPGLNALMRQCTRALQCCMHETFMDCPWYEQQFWVGDARVQMLVSHVMSADDRLVRRCLEFLAATRWAEGPTQGRYPAPQQLSIPSFALAFCGMVHDFARWRGDPDFVRGLMPAVRGTLDFLCGQRPALTEPVMTPFGWHYTDWVSAWQMGEPPGSHDAPSAVFNWWVVGALNRAAELESWLDEPERAARCQRLARELSAASVAAFWDPQKARFRENPGAERANEHAQIMAVLSGLCPAEILDVLRDTLRNPTGMDATNLYFDHYHFEALAGLGLWDRWWAKLEPYLAFSDLGLATTPEHAGATRSDCHAWAAHPRLHVVTDLLGLRPVGLGFERARLSPQPGGLNRLAGGAATARGPIKAAIEKAGGGVRLVLDTPVPIELDDGNDRCLLRPGRHERLLNHGLPGASATT